jgi:hypothetical protein
MSDFTMDELSAESVEVLPNRDEMIFGVVGVVRYVASQPIDGGLNIGSLKTIYVGIF